MKAKVKRIKAGTCLDVDGHCDTFVAEMKSKNFLEFVSYYRGISGKWWIGTTDDGWEFNYHISWLKDIQE